MSHPNEAIIRQLIIACAPDCRNPDVLTPFLAEQAVYHIPGWNVISGEYRGWEAISRLTQRRAALLSTHEHHIKFLGSTASDEHVAMLHHFEATVQGKVIAWHGNSVYFMHAGKIAECWLFVDDEEAFNEFWGMAADKA